MFLLSQVNHLALVKNTSRSTVIQNCQGNLTFYISQFSILSSSCLWWLLQEEINCWNFLISRSRQGGCLSKETTPVDMCEKLFVNKCFELSIYLKKSKNQQCLPKETTPVDICWTINLFFNNCFELFTSNSNFDRDFKGNLEDGKKSWGALLWPEELFGISEIVLKLSYHGMIIFGVSELWWKCL